jgi:hypothetical protein
VADLGDPLRAGGLGQGGAQIGLFLTLGGLRYMMAGGDPAEA